MTDLITLTDSAAKEIEEKIKAKEGAIGLRLRVKSGGCAGNEYQMEYVMGDDDVSKDQEFRHDQYGDAILYVPFENIMFLVNMQIDFESDQMGKGFKFNNPNVADACGCGESFSVKDLPKPRSPK